MKIKKYWITFRIEKKGFPANIPRLSPMVRPSSSLFDLFFGSKKRNEKKCLTLKQLGTQTVHYFNCWFEGQLGLWLLHNPNKEKKIFEGGGYRKMCLIGKEANTIFLRRCRGKITF